MTGGTNGGTVVGAEVAGGVGLSGRVGTGVTQSTTSSFCGDGRPGSGVAVVAGRSGAVAVSGNGSTGARVLGTADSAGSTGGGGSGGGALTGAGSAGWVVTGGGAGSRRVAHVVGVVVASGTLTPQERAGGTSAGVVVSAVASVAAPSGVVSTSTGSMVGEGPSEEPEGAPTACGLDATVVEVVPVGGVSG